ncbi:ashwin-like [Pecten maximus]|uniref:ashwin-like n=1 Tax=Pecten maximus TaxID=6579 RepID=UPI0014580FCE|nr:ashwin-like [Pecten maximus]
MAATQQDADRKQQFDWLYPELLSKDGLLDILRQRYVNHPDIERLEKDDLVELYYKYVIPLPQRKYRMNRRGREMTKKQILLAKKRKIMAPDETEPAKKRQHEDSTTNSRFITSFNDPSKAENRLKPPPSCIDFKKKTIKLGSSLKPSPTHDNDCKGDTDSQPGKKKIKLISFSSSETSPTLSPKEKSPAISPPVTSPTKKDFSMNKSKTIGLINKHLADSDTSAKEKPKTSPDKLDTNSESHNSKSPKREEDTEKESVPKKKIRINRIPWP